VYFLTLLYLYQQGLYEQVPFRCAYTGRLLWNIIKRLERLLMALVTMHFKPQEIVLLTEHVK
jgi:hypothetical protein